MMRDRVLRHLTALVAADSQNPPRAITPEHALFGVLRSALPAGFRTQVWDHGAGCVSLLCVRGNPSVLFNFHVDTVPVAPGWTRPPHTLHVDDTRATGLGAADIKGAAACTLAAVEDTRGDVALLFSSDEEAGNSTCIRAFVKDALAPFRAVIVAEPTQCRAVVAHRGIATATGTFSGTPGHASEARVLQDSAVHQMMRWGGRALAQADAEEAREYGGLRGTRLNVGYVEGGQKPNMIAARAVCRVGVRPLPNEQPVDVMKRYQALAPDAARVTWELGFVAPPLPRDEALGDAARAFAAAQGLTVGPAVDFWTEAALFSAAGVPTVVYGPGNIAQAHTADEWVLLTDLDRCAAEYVRMLGGTQVLGTQRNGGGA